MILISCSDSKTETTDFSNIEDHTPLDGTIKYSFTNSSKLKVTSLEGSYLKLANIEIGNDLVFEYRFDADDEESIADDEYSETIKFQIDASLENFFYQNIELSATKITFTKYCFCYFPLEISKNINPFGTLEGTKISDTEWEIKMNIVFYGEDRRVIDQSFFLSIAN